MKQVFLFGILLLLIACKIRYIELDNGKVIKGKLHYRRGEPVIKSQKQVIMPYHINRISKKEIKGK